MENLPRALVRTMGTFDAAGEPAFWGFWQNVSAITGEKFEPPYPPHPVLAEDGTVRYCGWTAAELRQFWQWIVKN